MKDEYLTLKGDLFWRWRAHSSEQERLAAMVNLKTAQLNDLLRQHPDVKQAIDERAGLASEMSQAVHALKGVQAEIEKKFHISLEGCAIDDKTGRIYNVDKTPVTRSKTNGAKKVSVSKPK